MLALKKFLDSLNPVASCKKYDVSFWHCPQLLFLAMGLVIMGALIATYFIANLEISDPFIVALIVLSIGAILLIINFIITSSFERMAEASRMKTEFIGIVSHQLRTPLTNLRFSVDFLMSGITRKPDEKETEYFLILKENIKKMGDLIDNLLTISRIESGDFPLNKELVSLEEIVKKLIMKFKPFYEASNIRISMNVQNNLPQFLTNPLWLEQVIENLLDNAIRYTKGGGDIKINIQQKNKKIYFEIQDMGVGIPKEEQKYIFEKFFRSKNVLKHQTQGIGLGLHIVKKIIGILGGKINFCSKENQGTTFWFILPIKS